MKLRFIAVVMVLTPLASFAASTGNALKGEEIFAQCIACHKVGDAAEAGVGPALNHVFGRQAGAGDGFQYSPAMAAKGSDESLIWDEQSLYTFLAGPARYIPGTIMGFEGLSTEKQIKDVLAYLIQYSPAYVPGSGKIVPANIASNAALPKQKEVDSEEAVPDFTEAYMASTDAIVSGGELWAKQCRHCHGNSAYPGKAPKLTTSRYTSEFVFKRVTDGFRKMPAWKTVFTLEERMSVVAYVMSDKFSP